MSYNPNNPDPVFDEDGDILNEPTPVFPVLLLELDPGDRGYEEGYRYRLDQLDEDQHFFRTWERAEHFVRREGMDVIEIDQMMAMRENGSTY